MARGRPGGNPDISDYASMRKHEWSEPCTTVKSLRVPPLMNEAIKEYLPNWQEICRRAIARELPEEISAQLGWPFDEESE